MKTVIPLLILLVGFGPARASPEQPSSLDAGFTRMYQLKFPEAREVFDVYIREHPDDPRGQVSLAATYLFEEFNKQGVLTSSFFLSDKKLLGGITDAGSDRYQKKFLQANARAGDSAEPAERQSE